MKKRYIVKLRSITSPSAKGAKVIMATNDKAKAYFYGRSKVSSGKELIIEDTEAGTTYRALRA